MQHHSHFVCRKSSHRISSLNKASGFVNTCVKRRLCAYTLAASTISGQGGRANKGQGRATSKKDGKQPDIPDIRD